MPPLLPSKADLLKVCLPATTMTSFQCNGCAKLHQRPDDTEEIIQNRLLTYEKNHKEVFRALEGVSFFLDDLDLIDTNDDNCKKTGH
uniref:Nucleoside monophosphate kinase n=1 Tax=Babesia bovis TaxID=5865 RepID=S6BH36_BABBO|nr:nucleoside monophosphate kinase [Babesia bovis]